ncbi:hypothetical protein MWU75_07035 [Ornithinimicrobium sp. F0845]|uniref:hypothetical protein n=1 Tax=Ornithinimicrobium sp. F0845 TaxID=2926412 RepID=UPI001FF6EEB7|nr:hypothetical protein [Ornithinimicrobium sp. F0845]MCK0111888.1 hypothetical protein [Ornithinimicrobium sp. F0845]
MANITEAPSSAITIRVGREDVEVKRLAPELSKHLQMPRHEATFIRAFERAEANAVLSTVPDEQMIRAFSRATSEAPTAVVGRIESGITKLSTDIADVSVLRTAMSCLGVLPGDQPRGAATGGRATQVPDPVENIEESEALDGLRVLIFNDPQHVRDWSADAIARSLERAKKRGRQSDIGATGTRRPISVSMVLIEFEDGTASQWVPMASDGISRLSVCAASILGVIDKKPEDAAKVVATALVPDNLDEASGSHDLVRNMAKHHTKWLNEYLNHVTDEGPDEDGVRIRQYLVLPADVYLLAVDSETGDPHEMESAMQGIVSDTHTDVDGWAPEDQARHTVIRALTQMAENDMISEDFYRLCTGRAPATVSDEIFEPEDGVSEDQVLLRRAVTILALLLDGDMYSTFKRALRQVGGHGRLDLTKTVNYMAPLVCEPWGTAKPITRAWAYGGPVPPALESMSLIPQHPADYLDLVDIALDEEDPDAAEAARVELALAGGTALLADGVLSAALVGGAGGSKESIAFRGPVNVAVDALTKTEDGLTILALAANNFSPTVEADKARPPQIDHEKSDKVKRDGTGKPHRVTLRQIADLAVQGDPSRKTDKSGDNDPKPKVEEDDEQMLRRLAAELILTVHNLKQDVDQVESQQRIAGGASTGLSQDDKKAMLADLTPALTTIAGLQ